MTQMAIDNINTLLDSFMGINDSELAEQVRKLEYDNGIFAGRLARRHGRMRVFFSRVR